MRMMPRLRSWPTLSSVPVQRPLENVPGVMHVPKGQPSTTDTGLGWPILGAVVLTVSALLNATWGVLQLANNFYFGDSLTRPHVETWGWLWISYAVVELTVAVMVLAQNGFGLLAAAALLALNIALHIPALGGHHIGWAVATIGVNLLALWSVLTPWYRSR